MGAVASRGRTTAPAALARCMLVRRVYRCGVVLLNELALLPFVFVRDAGVVAHVA